MSELETKTEAEVEDFTDELSDEALDREEGGVRGSGTFSVGSSWNMVHSD